jgi:hypothetical protein
MRIVLRAVGAAVVMGALTVACAGAAEAATVANRPDAVIILPLDSNHPEPAVVPACVPVKDRCPTGPTN